MDIIEEIYYCERAFYEENVVTEEFKEAKKEFNEAYESLLNKLPSELKGEFDEVYYKNTGVTEAACASKFKDGFRVGFKLAAETLLQK